MYTAVIRKAKSERKWRDRDTNKSQKEVSKNRKGGLLIAKENKKREKCKKIKQVGKLNRKGAKGN